MDLASQLRDIKPNVQITDYWFYIAVTAGIILFLVVMYLIYRFMKKKKPNPYLLKLKNLDFSDSKKTAYEFSEYAKFFVNDTNESFYNEIVKELEKYKYRPVVDPLSKETKEKIKKFISELK